MSTVDKDQFNELLKVWQDGAWLTGGEIVRLAEGLCLHGDPASLPDLLAGRMTKAPHEAQKDVMALFCEVMACCPRSRARDGFKGAWYSIKKRLVEDEKTIDLFIATYLMLERNRMGLQQRNLLSLWTEFIKLNRTPHRFDLWLMLASSR
jgi:hypothetical protein